jgi:hypothetical protein
MMYRAIIAVWPEIHAKHKRVVGRTQNFWLLKVVVHEVSLGLWKVNIIQILFDYCNENI